MGTVPFFDKCKATFQPASGRIVPLDLDRRITNMGYYYGILCRNLVP
jgi:hypothetical protein